MYIKLGSINLQYYQETNDWFIVGEIVDSGMSYEKPILVRTTDELDIWFGKDYKDYSYMQELINMGVVMYLYKPVSNKTTGYIDLDDYVEDDSVWLRDAELDWISEVLKNPEAYKFKYDNGTEIKDAGYVVNTDGSLLVTENVSGRKYCTEEIVRKELINPINQVSRIHKSNIKFHVFNSDDLWIYEGGKIVDTELLPQNINLTSNSWNNRDTLVVSSESDVPEFTYLDYNFDSEELGIFEDTEFIEGLDDVLEEYKGEIDSEKIATGYQTLMFRVNGSNLGNDDYFVMPDAGHGLDTARWTLYYKGNLENVPEEVRNSVSLSSSVTNYDKFINKLKQKGYQVKTHSGNTYLYSRTILPVTNFYKSSTITLIPETRITEAVISRYITPTIEAVSKTIGRSSEFEDDLIQLVIEKTGVTNYRATISRYTYSEVFDGTLKPEIGEERLDNTISRESKLIRCWFYGDELRTGTYYLRGAKTEIINSEMYKYSLKQMLSTEYNEPAYPDYFLIPDKYKYTSDIIEDSPYPLFLDYSKEVGCQFLIENIENGLNGNGDYIYNLTGDQENRLVYFFKPMTYKYEDRPGYYVYLRGLLLNDYSVSVKDILYRTPTKDAFDEENLEDLLKQYKTNYLVCDNQTYFYKEYQDGNPYITTGWTRFIAGKIFRELQKNSGDILGQQLLGKIRSNISDLLGSIVSGFSIVKSISIAEFEPSDNGQSLKITLNTVMNDLVKNNVILDVTVNYNNNIITYGTIS